MVHQRYKYSCFGFVTYRGDEENNDNKQVNPKDDDDDDRKGKIEDDSIRSNTTTAEFDEKNPGPQVVPFPWEPTSSSSIKFIKQNCTPKIQNEELNFMATMTFANGGIRAPTCPCCY